MNFSVSGFRQVIVPGLVASVLALSGCGGSSDNGVVAGDGGTNPGSGEGNGTDPVVVNTAVPKSPTATFGDTENDAIALTGFVSRAQTNLQEDEDNNGDNNNDDEPPAPIQPDPGDNYDTFSLPVGQSNSAVGASHSRLKVFTTTPDCSFVFRDYAPIRSCSGSIPIETNFDEYGLELSRYPAGAYLAYSFAGVSVVTADGRNVDLSGDYRFTVKGPDSAQVLPVYRGDFYLDTTNYVGLDENGLTIGPVSGRQDVTFHDDGSVSLILRGARYRSYVFIRGENEQTYRVQSGSMIARFGNGYAQVDFSDWNVIDGVPQLGSRVTVIGRDQETSAIEVVGASPTQVQFAVLVSSGGVLRDYLVTASVTPEGLKL